MKKQSGRTRKNNISCCLLLLLQATHEIAIDCRMHAIVCERKKKKAKDLTGKREMLTRCGNC